MEENENNESKYRINIKQTSKGYAYYDITVKGDTAEETSKRLLETLEIAKETCLRLNQNADL